MVDYANAEEVLARVQSTLQFEGGDRPLRSIDDRGMFGDTPYRAAPFRVSHEPGVIIVATGGGQREMHVAECDGAVSHAWLSK